MTNVLVRGMLPLCWVDAFKETLVSVAFGRMVRRARKTKGLTQKELATKTGIWTSQLSRYERGTEMPRRRNLEKLANGLGVRVSDMVC